MLHYCERLNKLEAETLEMRRLKLDLVMYYNILHGFVDIDAGSLFDTINCNVIRSRGHPLRIIKQHCNVNCRSSSFVCRNVNAWNNLPEHVVNCKTTATFKRRLSTVDLTQFVNASAWCCSTTTQVNTSISQCQCCCRSSHPGC